jgi:hypothetical protein
MKTRIRKHATEIQPQSLSTENRMGKPTPATLKLAFFFAVVIAAPLLAMAQNKVVGEPADPSSNQVRVFGFTHTSIGSAQLSVIPATHARGLGILHVSNLSPSGKDGVSVNVDGRIPNGSDLDFSSPSLDSANSPPAGSFVRIESMQGDQLISNMNYEALSSDVLGATFDMTPINPTSITAEVYRDGQLLEIVPGLPSKFSAKLGSVSNFTWDISLGFPCCPGVSFDGDIDYANFFSGDAELFSLGPGTYHVFLKAQNATLVDNYTSINITSSLPDLNITNETCFGPSGGCLPPSRTMFFSDLGPSGSVYQCCAGWTVSGSNREGGGASSTAANQFLVASSGSVSQIDAAVGYVSGVNSFYVAIYSDDGGVPGAQLAAWNNLSSSTTFGTCCGLVTITGISGLNLTAGINYWMVIGPMNLGSATWEQWNLNTTGAMGIDLVSNDGGKTWNNNGRQVLGAFDILGD